MHFVVGVSPGLTMQKKSKMPKKKLAQLKGSAHPDNYGPKLCPADSCKKLIRSRGRLKEVYF